MGSLAASTFLLVLVLLASPAQAVRMDAPAVADGQITVIIDIEDRDNLPDAQILLHFKCGTSGSFTEVFDLVPDFEQEHAILRIIGDATTDGYGYFQGLQT